MSCCTVLHVYPTGLLELSSAVVFCKPAALCALSSLQALSVSFIPMPSVAALSHLPQLGSLVLRQAQPVSSSQCLALARCRRLRDLSLSSVLWADMPNLAPLTGLTKLAVQVGWAQRGRMQRTLGRQGSGGWGIAGQQLGALQGSSRRQAVCFQLHSSQYACGSSVRLRMAR